MVPLDGKFIVGRFIIYYSYFLFITGLNYSEMISIFCSEFHTNYFPSYSSLLLPSTSPEINWRPLGVLQHNSPFPEIANFSFDHTLELHWVFDSLRQRKNFAFLWYILPWRGEERSFLVLSLRMVIIMIICTTNITHLRDDAYLLFGVLRIILVLELLLTRLSPHHRRIRKIYIELWGRREDMLHSF